MNEIVTFSPQDTFRKNAEEVVSKHQQLIKGLLPDVDVRHIGSTAIKGALTKGDVDLQVRVTDTDLTKRRTL